MKKTGLLHGNDKKIENRLKKTHLYAKMVKTSLRY